MVEMIASGKGIKKIVNLQGVIVFFDCESKVFYSPIKEFYGTLRLSFGTVLPRNQQGLTIAARCYHIQCMRRSGMVVSMRMEDGS